MRFLKAGIIENIHYYESDKGTPQKGVDFPIFTNIYLHYVPDMWFDKVIEKHYEGEAYTVRYTDDFVCFFQYESEAKKFYRELEERLVKDKSKVMRFGRFVKQNSKDGRMETFDFLGFTFINGKTRTTFYASKKKLKAK